MIQRLPPPPRLLRAATNGSHFIACSLHHLSAGRPRVLLPHAWSRRQDELGGAQALCLRVVMPVVGLTLYTQVVSRMSLRCSAMATMCCLPSATTPGGEPAVQRVAARSAAYYSDTTAARPSLVARSARPPDFRTRAPAPLQQPPSLLVQRIANRANPLPHT